MRPRCYAGSGLMPGPAFSVHSDLLVPADYQRNIENCIGHDAKDERMSGTPGQMSNMSMSSSTAT